MSANQVSPASFYLEGGATGVLLVHGYTGAPPEMRLLGDYLHARGMTVFGPLLPGHGSTPEDMNSRSWREWVACVESAYETLRARCDQVVVGGLSMGALLTLYLAADHPELPCALAYSPAVKVSKPWLLALTPVLKHIISTLPKGDETDLVDPEAPQRLWHYEVEPVRAADEVRKLIQEVRKRLPRITCPVLIVHSTRDKTIAADSASYTYQRIASTDKELVTLHNSGHCLTVDAEWEMVARKTHEFILAHLPGRGEREISY